MGADMPLVRCVPTVQVMEPLHWVRGMLGRWWVRKARRMNHGRGHSLQERALHRGMMLPTGGAESSAQTRMGTLTL